MHNSNEPKSNEPPADGAEDVSAKLRLIFRKRRRLAVARQRQGKGCSLSVLIRVMLHIYRRVHRRFMKLFVRAFVRVNFVRVLQGRPNVVKPLD